MKKGILLIIGAVVALCACETNKRNYSQEREIEDRLIENYIARCGIKVIETLPADDYVWQENEYYKVAGYDNLYFHLVKRGDSIKVTNSGDSIEIDPIGQGQTILLRYKEYELTENSDTTRYWNTNDSPYPVEVKYDGYGDKSTSCEGWQVAMGLMKYPNSECKVIVPSKQGFSAAVQSVKPYGYDLYMRVKP